MPPNRKKNRSLVSNSDKIAHLTHNWKHRTSNQQNWSILHPAGRLHSHLDSLRSTTIQPCTWFAGIPEAPYHSAFSKGFSFFSFIFFWGNRWVCDTSLLWATDLIYRTRLIFYRFIVFSFQSSLIFFIIFASRQFWSGYLSVLKQRGFRVLLTSHWQSVCANNVSAFPFNFAGERPRGAGSFVVGKKNK